MILLQCEKVKKNLYLELGEVCKIIIKQVWLCLLFFFIYLFVLGYQESFANGAKVCERYIA